MPHIARTPRDHGVAHVVGTKRHRDTGGNKFINGRHRVVHRTDHFRTGRVNPGRRAANHHHTGFLEKRVKALTIHAGVRTDRNSVNGDHTTAHIMFDRLVRKHFGFVFAGEIELIDVHMHHLILRFSGPKQNVKGFGRTTEVALIAFRQSADDVHHLGADIKPLTRFRINHTLESLVGKLYRDLIGVVLTSAKAGLDGAIFSLRINVHERSTGRAALLDHQFKEHGKTPIEIFFRRFAL